jgi:hypothetical protein
MRNPLKVLRAILTSHMLLALIAVQVFVQVWMHATNMPFIGLILSIWLSWKLGGLAAWADIQQRCIDHAQLVAKELSTLQEEYDGFPPDMRLALAGPYARAVDQLTRLHQQMVKQIQTPRVKLKFRDMLPSPSRWLARRRQRKIMASAKVVHA